MNKISIFVTNEASDAGSVPADSNSKNPLHQLSLTAEQIAIRKEIMGQAEFVASNIAMKGQTTTWFASPNSGKTLLALAMSAATKAQTESDIEIYHLNLDDDYMGLTTKAELGLDYGFYTIEPENFSDPLTDIERHIDDLIKQQLAHKTLLIIDTLKKFGDVMVKQDMSDVYRVLGRFASAGGSSIVLAHANKNTGDPAKSVPGGVSDIKDDGSAAYMLYIAAEEAYETHTKIYIVLRSEKLRGPNAESAVWSFNRYKNGDYAEMFASVKEDSLEHVDKTMLLAAAKAKQLEEQDLITLITEAISTLDKPFKVRIGEHVASTSKYSRYKAIQCLDRWCIPQEDGGLWYREHMPTDNAKAYRVFNID